MFKTQDILGHCKQYIKTFTDPVDEMFRGVAGKHVGDEIGA